MRIEKIKALNIWISTCDLSKDSDMSSQDKEKSEQVVPTMFLIWLWSVWNYERKQLVTYILLIRWLHKAFHVHTRSKKGLHPTLL